MQSCPALARCCTPHVPNTVPVADDLPTARALLPPEVRHHRDLPMDLAAALAARVFVREVCPTWSVPDVVGELAELVASELVSW